MKSSKDARRGNHQSRAGMMLFAQNTESIPWWGQLIIALVATLPATLAAISAFVASMRNAKKLDENTQITKGTAVAASKAAIKAEAAVEEVKEAVNGRFEKSVAEAKISGIAEGRLERVIEHVTVMATQIEANTGRIGRIESSIGNIEASVGELKESVGQRFERHSKNNALHMDQLRKEIAKLVLQGTVTPEEVAIAHDVGEIKDNVAEIRDDVKDVKDSLS